MKEEAPKLKSAHMPKCKQEKDKQQDVEWLQSELKRAKLFNTASHSTIVDLERKLKQQKEDFQRKLLGSRDMSTHERRGQQTEVPSKVHQEQGSSPQCTHAENQRLQMQLREQAEKFEKMRSQSHSENQRLRKENLALLIKNSEQSTKCSLLEMDVIAARQHPADIHLQLRFSSLNKNYTDLQGHYDTLQGCFRRMLRLANSTLKITDASDNVAQEGAGCILEYLRLVNRLQGMSASLDEIRRELPSKYTKNTGFGKRVKDMLFEYHPDKHTGTGRWNMAMCESVTKFLNSFR